jgi:hypothetical protein
MTPPFDVIEIREPERSEHVMAGTFEFTDKYGNARERQFYVITVKTDEDSENGLNRQGIRESDLNLQMMQAWDLLADEGATNIHYQDVRPSPFF